MEKSLSLPDNCLKCGLHNVGKSYKIRNLVDSRHHEALPEKPELLVVLDRPHYLDDKLGTPLSDNERVGGFLKKFLNNLETRWAVTYATRCWPGMDETTRTTLAVSDSQRSACRPFLEDTIREFSPKVIVCLGEKSMKSVMGKDSPKSLKAAGKAAHKLKGTESLVLVTRSPNLPESKFNEESGVTDASYRALIQEYYRVFSLAEKLAIHGPDHHDLDWEFIRNKDKAIHRFRNLTADTVFIDVETSTPLKGEHREAETIWHPKASLICVSCSWLDPTGKIKTVVVAGPAMCPEVIQLMVGGRAVYAHSLKYDAQALWALLGVDIFVMASSFGDTFLEFYLTDQELTGNGLKDLATGNFGIPDWSRHVWEQVEKLWEKWSSENELIRKEMHRREKILKKIAKGDVVYLRGLDKKLLRDDDGNKVAENPDTWEKLPELHKAWVDLSDLPTDEVALYNAFDTHNTARLRYEILDVREFGPDPLAVEHSMRSTWALSRVERRGLPVDMEYLKGLRKSLEKEVLKIKWRLLQEPEVKKALSKLPPTQEAVKQVKRSRRHRDPVPVTLKDVYDWVKVQGHTLFYEHLVQDTIPAEDLPKTKDGKISSNNKFLMEISKMYIEEDDESGFTVFKSKIPEEDRTRVQDLWRLFLMARKNEDLISKFVEEYELYTIEGRVHTDFVIAKTEKSGQATGADLSGGGSGAGRISSRNPNAQQIKKDLLLRSCFRSTAGKVLVELDFDRIEPVCLAAVANCEAWKKIFAPNGHWDIYREIANEIFDVGITLTGDAEIDKVNLKKGIDETMRSVAKVSTLAIMYGESPYGFSWRTGKDIKDVEAFFKKFKASYPEIYVFQDSVKRAIDRGEIIKTWFGRQKTFPITGESKRSRVYRQGINYVTQSLASDICLWKLYEIFEWIDQTGIEDIAHPVNVVHDAIWFEIEETRLEDILPEFVRIMENVDSLPFYFPLPMRVSPKLGKDLGHMRKPEFEWRK